MRRIIFNALFTLVLVLSFSLVPAMPAMANGGGGPNPTFATVSMPSMTTPSANINIGWERGTTNYSGTDAIHVTTSAQTSDFAMVIVPTDFVLGGSTISYWGYTVAGDVKAPDEIYLFLDSTGGTTYNTLLTSHKPGPVASDWYGEWHEWNSTDAVRLVEGQPGNEWHDAANYPTLVDPSTYSAARVLAIALTAGPSTISGPVNVDVYFDRLTVNGSVLLDNDTGTIDVPVPFPGQLAPSIQDAIDAALPSDTITVAAGTYNEQVVIDKQLTLNGANADVNAVTGGRGSESIIDGGTETAITISADDVIVDGFTLDGGITLDDLVNSINGGTISNNIITGADNSVTKAQNGLRVGFDSNGKGVDGVTIENNTIIDSLEKGIRFSNTKIGDEGPQRISDITISGNEIKGNGSAGIETYGPGPNRIINNIISGNDGNGMNLKFGSGDVVTGNIITNNTGPGITLRQATDTTVENNSVSGHQSQEVITTCDTVLGGKGSGIHIFDASENNTIRFNDISGNNYGIFIHSKDSLQPSGNSINFNNIAGNIYSGVLNALVDPPTPVDATNNWWGDATGPKQATTNPCASGAEVSSNVNYTPWLDTAYPDGNPRAYNVKNETQGTTHNSIQLAIDDEQTQAGDTINVTAGIYDEYVNINKSLTLSGQSGAIVKPSFAVNLPIIGTNADDVVVEGFEVDGTGLTPQVWAGIGSWTGCNDVTIRGNTVHDIANDNNGGNGICLWRGGDGNIYEDILIEGNTVYNTDRMGIYIGAMNQYYNAWLLSDNNIIKGNVVHNTMLNPNAGETFPGGCGGIALDAAKNCTIEGNTVYDTANTMPGIFLAHGSAAGNQILGNEAHDQAYGIAVDIDRGDVDFGSGSAAAPEVHFNNIHDNSEYGLIVLNTGGKVVNATNNWWGDNKGPIAVSGNVSYGPWLVIRISANPVSIKADGISSSTITADMTKNSDGDDTSSSGHIPDSTQITFSTSKGSITGSPTVNGKATATLTSSATVEAATVKASAPPHTKAATATTAVFFTKSGVEVKDSKTQTTSSGNVTIDAKTEASTSVEKKGTGTPTITVAKYTSNPGTGFSGDTGNYVDVHADNVTGVDEIVVKVYYTNAEITGLVESSLKLRWWTGTNWVVCSDSGVNTTDIPGPPPYNGYMWAKIRVDTTPNLSDLGGTVFTGGGERPAPAVGGGGGWAPSAPPGTTDIRGKVTTAGRFTSSVTATSDDGLCTLTIPAGTVGLTNELEPLTKVTMLIKDEPPSPPKNAYVIGFAYDFWPDGATFDPPITLTWSYDPSSLPEGVAEEDMVLAYYDEEAGEWVELDCVVDTENNIITASVPHFTTFAIIGVPPAAFTCSSLVISPTEVTPAEKVNISISVANTGGREGLYTVVLKINGVKEAEKSVTIVAGSSQDVIFSVAKEFAGSYGVIVDGLSGGFTVVVPPSPLPPRPAPTPTPVTPVPPPTPAPVPTPPVTQAPTPSAVNWPLIGGSIGGAIVVVLVILLLVRRRAA